MSRLSAFALISAFSLLTAPISFDVARAQDPATAASAEIAARRASKPAPGTTIRNTEQERERAKFKYFETLGEKGWDVPRPSTQDSVIADEGGVRSKLAEYGIGFLGLANIGITGDALHEQGGIQYYNGQRPTWTAGTQFSISLNLDRYGLPGGQITAAEASDATSWKPLGPRSFSLLRLWYYQSLFNGALAFKIGYLVEPVEFMGTFVGGNIVSGILGPNAQIPAQVGQSSNPIGAPGANVRWNLPDHFYLKSGIQRSIDPLGRQAEHDANPTGFAFETPHARALFINEVGYNRPASNSENSMWIRGGGMYNSSPYPVFGTNQTSTNASVFVLADTQFIKTDPRFPYRGIYAGATFMSGDPNVDATSRYYEARIYGVGVIPGRPSDFISLVVNQLQLSSREQALARATGSPAPRAIDNLSLSYSVHVTRGVFLVNGITYANHAANSVITRPALVLSSTLSLVL